MTGQNLIPAIRFLFFLLSYLPNLLSIFLIVPPVPCLKLPFLQEANPLCLAHINPHLQPGAERYRDLFAPYFPKFFDCQLTYDNLNKCKAANSSLLGRR